MSTGFLLIAQPDGQTYFQLEYIEAKRMFYTGQITPEQYIWSIAKNQWVAAKDFFQEAKKQSVRIMTEYAKKTQTAALKTAQQAADATKRIVASTGIAQRRVLPAVAQGYVPRRAVNVVAPKEASAAPAFVLGVLLFGGVAIAAAAQFVPTEMVSSDINILRPLFTWGGASLGAIASIPFFISVKRLLFKK